MKSFLLFSAAIAILGVGGSVCALILDVPVEIRAFRGDVARQADALRRESLAEIDKQAGGIRRDLVAQVSDISGQVNEQLTGARQDVRDSVFLAVTPVEGLRTDLAPILANLQSITGHVDQAAALSPELARNALGAVAAFKVTSGELTKTAIDFRRATPGILAMVNKVGTNSDAATAEAIGTAKESRRMFKNAADNITPLPKFIRYPAQVIGLIGSAAVPVVTLEKLSTIK